VKWKVRQGLIASLRKRKNAVRFFDFKNGLNRHHTFN
jgi:hypothetical protein